LIDPQVFEQEWQGQVAASCNREEEQ